MHFLLEHQAAHLLQQLQGQTGKPPWLRVLGLFHPRLLVIDLKRRRARGWRIRLQVNLHYQKILSRNREHTLRRLMPLSCQKRRPQKRTWSENSSYITVSMQLACMKLLLECLTTLPVQKHGRIVLQQCNCE